MSVVIMDSNSMEAMIQNLNIMVNSGNARCSNVIRIAVERCKEILKNSPCTKEEVIISLKEFDEMIRRIVKIKNSDYAKAECGVVIKVADRVLETLYWFVFHKMVS